MPVHLPEQLSTQFYSLGHVVVDKWSRTSTNTLTGEIVFMNINVNIMVITP